MNKLTTRATASVAASALVASGLAFATFTPQANAAVLVECSATTETVSIFAINDFHGRIGEAAELFSTVEQARIDAGADNVALISSGDNIGASTFESMVADDKPTLDILNAAGLDVSAVGNHEFDKTWDDLAGRVQTQSEFDYLGANVYNAGTTTVAAPLKAYEVIEKGGVRIAVVGVVTSETPSLVDPTGVANLTFGDPIEAVNRVTAEVLDGDLADIVVASFHEGAGTGGTAAATTDFGAALDDVDERVAAIFNAHTHQTYSFVTDDGTPVVQAASYGTHLSKVDLTVNADGSLCETVGSVVAAGPVISTPVITEINAIVAAAEDYAAEVGQTVIGEATEAISTPVDGSASNRNVESPMTNMVAQMFHEVLGGGDPYFIGIQNPGGTRDSFDAGDITYREAALTLPFANSLFTTQITGAQFIEVLNEQWQREADGDIPSRPYLALGLSDNVRYTYDESLPEGERITSVWINDEPIELDKRYTVGSGSFLIGGGDNFRTLAEGVNTRDTGRADLEAWVTWVEEQGTLSPDYTVRGVSAKLSTEDLVEGGDAIYFTFGTVLEGGVATQTLDMKLNDTGGKVSPPLANRQVKAYIGNAQVGSGVVRNGQATVAVWLPDGTSVPAGEQIVDFLVLESGTVISAIVNVVSDGPVTPPAKFVGTAPYTKAGLHNLNGRRWLTTCEPYSQTERCRTEIWATVVKVVDGKYVHVNDWVFNNLTYLPYMTRSEWGNNPLANAGDYVLNGRQWRTECDTALTGPNACRSYIMATVIEATPLGGGKYTYKQVNKYILNNIVMFGNYTR